MNNQNISTQTIDQQNLEGNRAKWTGVLVGAGFYASGYALYQGLFNRSALEAFWPLVLIIFLISYINPKKWYLSLLTLLALYVFTVGSLLTPTPETDYEKMIIGSSLIFFGPLILAYISSRISLLLDPNSIVFGKINAFSISVWSVLSRDLTKKY